MTAVVPTTSSGSLRRTALVAGVAYLLTFVSIPTLSLYGKVREPGYVTGPGPDTPVIIGGVLEMIVALACIGTAIALYPVVKRQNEGAAVGFVASRTLEAATIVACVVSLLSIVSLRQTEAGPGAAVVAQGLVAFHDQIFLLGQGFLPAVNALLIGSLLYGSRLVPRALPILGFVGAVLQTASVLGTLFGAWAPQSAVPAIATVPIAVWELSLGVYLIAKGFRPSPITEGSVR